MFQHTGLKRNVVKTLLTSLVSLAFAVVPVQNSYSAAPVGGTNATGTVNGALMIAYRNAGTAVVATTTAANRSVGLAFVDSASAGAYNATVALSGTLALYVNMSTAMAISSSGGTITASATANSAVTGTLNSTYATAIAFTTTASGTAHTASTSWVAPSTAGTYTIKAFVATHPGTAANIPTSSNPEYGTSVAVITVTVGGSHPVAGAALNGVDTLGAINGSMFVAVQPNTGADAVIHPTTTLGVGEASAFSRGLLSKDTSFRTAQSATVLASGRLSLYAQVSTTAAFTASGGTFADSAGIGATATYSENLRTTVLSGPTTSAVATIATLWTAPSTAGTYTVSLGVSDGVNTASITSPTPSLAASITVTVVAASSGGTYSAAYSACNTATTTTAGSAVYPSGIDASSTPRPNGESWYIDFDADDAYDASLPATTNVVISATNGAYVSIGNAGTAPAAGTASTVATTVAPTNKNVRITQGAAGPVTTTVTITINGIVACTKTVTIAGEVAKLAISGIGTQALSTGSSTVYTARDADADGRTDGLFTVKATDSAGNLVATSTVGTFSYVAATLTPTVQMVTVNSSATTNSSTSAYSTSLGAWTCGSSAGTSNVKIQYTNTGTGTVITSDAFAARCAGDPDTYTASFDKASYVQGEIATLTVKFVDSKGNPANQKRIGTTATSITTPMLTAIDSVTSTTSYPKADGSRVYTFAVGISTGITAGKYTAVVNYPDLTDVNATKATPSYSVSTGSTDVSFTEILKSVVALIASINKQIQALQKLILKR